MKTDTKKTNIYQKLLEIQKAIMGLAKNTSGFNFSYVSGSKVLGEIKPLMNQYGLILKQELVELENTRQDYKDSKGFEKSEILSKCRFRFTWVDCDTGELDVNYFHANGQNGWDKGVGSAMTYAERYFLLKYFHIATDEDDIDLPKKVETDEPNKTQNTPIPQDPETNEKSFEHAYLVAEWTEVISGCFNLEDLNEKFKQIPQSIIDVMRPSLTKQKNEILRLTNQ